MTVNTPSEVWVSPEFLNWSGYPTSYLLDEEEAVREQQEIWHHANLILENVRCTHDLVLCLFQLNRVVDFRDQLLEKCYGFRNLPGFSRRRLHDILEEVGLVKPIMRKKLNTLRNRLAHSQDAEIPTHTECEELSEFVWYFLRSTDRFSALPIATVDFDYHRESDMFHYGVEITNARESWNIELLGRIDVAHFCMTYVDQWVRLTDVSVLKFIDNNRVVVRGLVTGEQKFKLRFAKRLFEIY